MPSYRSHCRLTETCGYMFEWESPRMSSDDPICPECNGPTERVYWPVAAIWCKGIAQYGDPKSGGFHKQQKAGGHWTLEADKETGKVSKVFIDTPKAQADFCKRNNLINPKDIPPNLTVRADGKSYETTNRSEI